MPTSPATHRSTSAMAVAVDHHCLPGLMKPPISNRRCRLRSFPHPDPNLLDLDKPSSPSFHRSLSTPCFSSASKEATADQVARVEITGGRQAHAVPALVVEAAIAMASGVKPVPASSSGLGGAYILRNRAGESFAVVKPVDEEPLARWRRSVRAGGTVAREVAAYLLDHNGFSGVPPTALIKISQTIFTAGGHPATGAPAPCKIASVQRFVPHDFEAGDLGPSRFSISSVHRIGILDVRLLNVDRHAGNMLVKKNPRDEGSYDNYSTEAATELIPIDHGLCLPELLDDPYFEWLHWPQAAVPFSDSEAEYISALDPFKDAELLLAVLPLLKESSIRILVLCTIFLKRAASAGLCLADIGGMMTREFCGLEEGPSALEVLCKRAAESMNNRFCLEDGTEDDTMISNKDEDDAECEEFQFDMEYKDGNDGTFSETSTDDAVDVPLLLRCKPKAAGSKNGSEYHLQKVLVPPVDEEDEVMSGACSAITKSVSFSVADLDRESGVRGSESRFISFEVLSEEEWGLFLEKFEQLLPEAFEARLSIGLKQRLGTSCKF